MLKVVKFIRRYDYDVYVIPESYRIENSQKSDVDISS